MRTSGPCHGHASGPATACVQRRRRDVFGDARFERLGSICVAHLNELRKAVGNREQRVVLIKTRGNKAALTGLRRAPAPDGRAGFVRIDSVHQETTSESRVCTTSTR